MNDIRHNPTTMAMLLLVVWLASAATAVELRFQPQVQNIDVDEPGTVAVWLDEPLEIRTIELTVAFDGAILSEQGGVAGQAFQDLPCVVWEEYDPGENEWYGFAVAIGSDCFVVGPGELFVWDFLPTEIATTYVSTVTVTLADRYAQVIEDVTLPAATVIVGDGITATDDLAAPITPTIMASPNPCNPRTVISFSLPADREVCLDLFDVEGRRVRSLLHGFAPSGCSSVVWDGRGDDGTVVPSGVYLYRLLTPRENLTGRLTLTR